jgi:rhamnogalacturonan endolyase
VHESKGAAFGQELHDARTGKILWGTHTGNDVGRGLAADVDPATRGHEMWSSSVAGIWSCTGEQLAAAKPRINFRIYWDGDLEDELLDGVRLDKWTGNGHQRLITLPRSVCNGSKKTPNFSGDILGDWREEVITHDDDSLYLTTTTIPTPHRLYTLAHDPVYRLAMSWQNVAYNQPPHLGFWLGAGVDKAPRPALRVVRPATTQP